MLGARLPREEHQFFRTVTVVVDVCNQLQSLDGQPVQAKVSDLDVSCLLRGQHDPRRDQHASRSLLSRLKFAHVHFLLLAAMPPFGALKAASKLDFVLAQP